MHKEVIFLPYDKKEENTFMLSLENMDVFDKIKIIKEMISRIETLIEKMNNTLKNSL